MAAPARTHPLTEQFDSDLHKALAEARHFLSEGILNPADAMKLVEYGFHKGFGCGWHSQEDRRERAYEELRNPEKAGHKEDIGRARHSGLPSDRFLFEMADAARAARAARNRGEMLKREAEEKREEWRSLAQKLDARLRRERPALSRDSRAKLVGKKVRVSYKTILRHIPGS